MDAGLAADAFERHFGRRPGVVAAAPGRVNLIGAHVDYNGGRVLPFAVAQRTIVAAARDDSGRIRLYSQALDREIEFSVDVSAPGPSGSWDNYVRGVVAGLRERGQAIGGARIWIGGDLPPGCGMSSSAALCVSTGMALAHLAGAEIEPREMAQLAQTAEHAYAGMPCGIMDQFASCFGREDHAILIDCRDLSHEYVPFVPAGVSILVIPSGVKHALADGAYEKRVVSCNKAVAAIAAGSPEVRSLRDVDMERLNACRGAMDDETFRRARHIVSEMERVTAAVDVLRRGELKTLGRLLWETQDSLRDDYEISCEEIDDMIGLLRKCDGVLGARMVGGGFGGIVLALIDEGAADSVSRQLVDSYHRPRHIEERPFRVRPAAGASVVRV